MEKYSISMRIMHWILGLIIIGAIVAGLYMTSLPPENPIKWELYDLHKSFGVIILIFALIRICLRLSSKIPILPAEISKLEVNLSKLGIILLYICMFVMPLSGYIASSAGGYGVKLFGMALPIFFTDKHIKFAMLLNQIHIYTAYFMIGVIVLHILAPFKHITFDKVNILKRII